MSINKLKLGRKRKKNTSFLDYLSETFPGKKKRYTSQSGEMLMMTYIYIYQRHYPII
jgi:hypothetical protein